MAKPWRQVLKLRADILKGELSQKEFAADLHDVIMGENRGVYHDPNDFFALTYPTTRLRELAKEVALRLAGQSDRAVRQLSLIYGGGKTHALITLIRQRLQHEGVDQSGLWKVAHSQCLKLSTQTRRGGLPRHRPRPRRQ